MMQTSTFITDFWGDFSGLIVGVTLNKLVFFSFRVMIVS